MSSALGLSIVFSAECIDAHALSGGRWLTTSESAQVFGATFDVTYFDGTDYVTSTASYTGGTRALQSAVGDLPSGIDCLQYTCPCTSISSAPQYITLDIRPQYSIFDTDQLHTAIFVYSTSTAAVPPYSTPQWRWIISGQEEIFTGELDNDDNISAVLVASDRCFYIPVDIDSQSTFTASSIRCTFVAPVSIYDNKLYFYLAPVYVSSDADASNGVQTTVTTGQNQGGAGVDLSETNGLLDSILDGISGLGDVIVDGISGLFIPEEGTIEAFENALADLLLDTFGGVDSDMLDSTIQDLLTHGATESVTWPAISVPGTSFSLPAYNVPLKPHSVQGRALYEALALAIDLVSTAAVINLVLHDIKVFLVGEKVVEVEDAD